MDESLNQINPSKMEELLKEELTDDEVREMLERLSVRDLGGSEAVTLGAIAEATRIDLVEAGKLLFDIRKEAFEERFGLRLDHHEKRIGVLEDKTKQLESASKTPLIRRNPAPPQQSFQLYNPNAAPHSFKPLPRHVMEENERKYRREAFLFTIAVILAIAAMLAYMVLSAASKSPPSLRWS